MLHEERHFLRKRPLSSQRPYTPTEEPPRCHTHWRRGFNKAIGNTRTVEEAACQSKAGGVGQVHTRLPAPWADRYAWIKPRQIIIKVRHVSVQCGSGRAQHVAAGRLVSRLWWHFIQQQANTGPGPEAPRCQCCPSQFGVRWQSPPCGLQHFSHFYNQVNTTVATQTAARLKVVLGCVSFFFFLTNNDFSTRRRERKNKYANAKG